MTSTEDSVNEGNVAWQGVHHLALVTNDMDATVRFYHGVLGARLVVTLGTPRLPPLLLRVGARQHRRLLRVRRPAARQFRQAGRRPLPPAAQFDHLSLALPDEEALLAFRDRLKRHDCEVTDVVDHQTLHSIYFMDPNGISLEASCWLADPTGGPVDYGDRRFFADPDPVPAVAELRRDGNLDWTPRTRLVDGITRDLTEVRSG